MTVTRHPAPPAPPPPLAGEGGVAGGPATRTGIFPGNCERKEKVNTNSAIFLEVRRSILKSGEARFFFNPLGSKTRAQVYTESALEPALSLYLRDELGEEVARTAAARWTHLVGWEPDGTKTLAGIGMSTLLVIFPSDRAAEEHATIVWDVGTRPPREFESEEERVLKVETRNRVNEVLKARDSWVSDTEEMGFSVSDSQKQSFLQKRLPDIVKQNAAKFWPAEFGFLTPAPRGKGGK